ncbi:MAG: DNA alkylation repair protein, partial [Firmicutes bacterium]|nr:DNA alkylation repair protein [Candidatus Caballimonas caccae]
MDLILDSWNELNILEYYDFQKTLISDKKSCEWEQKIINTTLTCYGKTASKATLIAKQIKKGNFLEFLDKVKIKTFFDSIVVAYLICEIKDFDLFKSKLKEYVLTIDNWASSDKLNFKKKDKEKLYLLSKEFLLNKKPFVRRTGVNIYFELIRDEKYLDKTFSILDSLKEEKEYFVNMCASWLLCECFSKYRDKTLEYFKNNDTNAFI